MDVFLPKGTRDLMPEQMVNRLRVIGTLRDIFARFGFEPLETPAFERIETLTGKYGEEGDKLIFKILERGEGGREGKADLALRYDLTVPLARVVAMHPELRLPWRRYAMQPVWRAERPGKGRFREFWQCDVDIAGTTSPLADAECLAVVAASLSALGFADYRIRLNDRRILADLAQICGATTPAEETSALVALDKLDKVGKEGVEAELVGRGFADEAKRAAFWAAVESTQGANPSGARGQGAYLSGARGQGAWNNEAALTALESHLGERGKQGVAVLRQVLAAAVPLGVPVDRIVVDGTLARGLDYYTGPVFETEIPGVKGSVSGGGRYDKLVGMFSGKDIPAVGVSLGIERIFMLQEELGMGTTSTAPAEVLVAVFGPQTLAHTLEAARALREAGIRTDVFADEAKLAKQFKHANARGYPWLLLVGPEEAAKGVVSLKDLRSGTQESVAVAEAVRRIRGA